MPGSVEIVEVVVMEEDDTKQPGDHQEEVIAIKEETPESENELTESDKIEEDHGVFTETSNDIEIKSETKEPSLPPTTTTTSIDLDVVTASTTTTMASSSSAAETSTEFPEELYDDLNIEVTKLDKSGKAKRDYSRTKKKEDKDFDILVAVAKAAMEDNELSEETPEVEKKFQGAKVKSENERSNSPWTEEDDMFVRRRRRCVICRKTNKQLLNEKKIFLVKKIISNKNFFNFVYKVDIFLFKKDLNCLQFKF